MRINKLIYRNIGPFGNETKELDISGDPKFWLIMGDNGAGKSTLLKMLKLVLYQEYENIPVDEIPNEINGNGYIGCQVDSYNKSWFIELGFKPNFLKVYQGAEPTNDNFLDTGKIPATKDFIRESVIDMPYYVFNNIISLSINDFKSFLKMSPKDSRNIRDRIFNFYVINEMNEIHKKKTSEISKDMDKLVASIEEIENSKISTQEKYNELKIQLEEKNQERISELRDWLNANNKKVESISDQIKDISSKSEKFKLELERNEINRLNEKLNSEKASMREKSEKMREKSEILKKLDDEVQSYMQKAKAADYIRLKDEINEIIPKWEDLKNNLGPLRDRYVDLKKKYESMQDKLQKAESNNQKRNNLLKNRESFDKLYALISERNIIQPFLDEEISKRDKINIKISEESTIISEKKAECKSISEKISLFESNKECPTCGSNLKDGDNLNKLSEMKENLDFILKDIKSREDSLLISKESINKSNEVISSNQDKLNKISWDISQIELDEYIKHSELDEIKKYIENTDAELDDIDEFDIEKIKSEKDNFKESANDIANEGKIAKAEFERLDLDLKTKNEKIKSLPEPEDLDNIGTYNDIFDNMSKAKKAYSNYSDEVNNLRADISSLEAAIENMESSIKSRNPEAQKAPEINEEEATIKLQELNENLSKIEAEKNTTIENNTKLEFELKSLTDNGFLKDQLKSISSMIEEYDNKIESHSQKINEYRRKITYNQLITKALSDSGIKSYIMKEIVPYLNHVIEGVLSDDFGLPIEVKFDSEFSPSVFRRGNKVSVNSISVGQTNITNLSILMAIIKLIIIRFKGINIVQFDEILSSISEKNRVIVLDCLHNIYKEEFGMNVFIVNHFFLPGGHIDKIINISVKEGFSDMDIVDPDEIMS